MGSRCCATSDPTTAYSPTAHALSMILFQPRTSARSTDMPIGSIESVVYGTDDIDAAVAFYDDFGLTLQSRSDSEVVYRLDEGSRVIIRLADDPSLPPAHYGG